LKPEHLEGAESKEMTRLAILAKETNLRNKGREVKARRIY
jgi:hypothetical protein